MAQREFPPPASAFGCLSLKMKLTELLNAAKFKAVKHSRSVHPKFLDFREITALHLKDRVANRSEKLQTNPCVPELTVFLACMKRNDFEESECMKQFTNYTNCVTKERNAAKMFKEASKQGLLGTSEGRKLTRNQVNKLMEMYPQPGSKRKKSETILPHQSYSDPLINIKARHY